MQPNRYFDMWAQKYNVHLGQEQMPYQTTVYLPIPQQSIVPNTMATSVLSMPSMAPAQAFIVVTSPQGNHVQPYLLQQPVPSGDGTLWGREQLPQLQPLAQPQPQWLAPTMPAAPGETHEPREQREQKPTQPKKSHAKKLYRYGASPEMMKSGAAFPSYYADPQKLFNRYCMDQ